MAESILKLRVDSQEYESKIKRAAQGIQRMAEACHKAGGTLNVLEDENRDFIKSLGNMETVSKSARGKIAELTTAFTDLKSVYNAMSAAEKNGEVGKELNKQLEIMKGRILDSKRELQDIGKELQGGNSKFGQFGSIIDGIGQKMGINANITELLISRTALLTGAIGASATAVAAATKALADYNSEIAKQQQITTVTTGLKGDDADKMTAAARALSKTYGVDFREAINAANTMMTQFGKSGDEAIQLLRDGMQGVIMGDGPKLLSMIQQYAPAFRDAGVSASQLVAVIQNSEGGIFTAENMNAIVMGIKNIRLMTKSTSDALAQLGIDGGEMTKALNEGTLTIFDALKQVAGQLKNVDSNSQAAGQVMQAVFGRQGAMAGTNLAKAIEGLNTNLEETKRQTGEVGDAFDQLYRANVKLEKALHDTFGYKGWEEMSIGIKTKLVSAMANVLDLTNKLNKAFESNFGVTFFESVYNSATRALGPLGTVLRLLKDIKKEQGDNKQGNTPQNNQNFDYIKGGSTKQEREDRYRKVLAEINKNLSEIGKEKTRTNKDGSTSFYIDDPAEQQRQRTQLLNQRKQLVSNRDKLLSGGNTKTTINVDADEAQIKARRGGGTTTSTKTPKTEEQLNNEQIGKLTQEYIKATDERRKAIEAEIKGLQQRNEEIQKLKDIALGKFKDDGSLPALTRQLQDLQKKQAESADGKEWDEYQKKIEEVTDKINVMKGVLPKDQQATFTLNVNAEQLEQLQMLLPTDDKTIKVNVEQGKVDLPIVPTDDKTIKVNITAYTADAMKQVRDLVSDIEGMDVVIEPKVEIQEQDLRTPFEKLQDSIRIQIAEQNIEVDTNTLQTLMKTAIENGIDSLNPDFASLQEKMREGINIPDETWKALQDEINAKLKELGIEPVKIDFSTGNVKKQSKEMAKDWEYAAQAVRSVGSAMSAIEDPSAKIIGTIGEAIANIALGFAMATAKDTKLGVWGWIAAVAGGLATMVSTISAIHSATGYANGGMIKGNSYSGDNLMAMGQDGGLIGLNAGEIVLSKSMQSTLANNLQGNGGHTVRVVGKISGSDILLSADRTLKTRGKQLAVWNG